MLTCLGTMSGMLAVYKYFFISKCKKVLKGTPSELE